MLRRISGDLYSIADRLREIDPEYSVWYRQEKNRFEVHHAGQGKDTLAVIVPYSELDYRTLELVRRTRTERYDEIAKETAREI